MKAKQFKYFIGALLLSTSACSSHRTKAAVPDTTVGSAEDRAAIVTESEKPKALNPEMRKAAPGSAGYSVIPSAGAGAEAIAAVVLVGTIMGISKVFRAPEEVQDLVGTCVYGEPASAIVSPCVNVTVHLLDSEKAVVASSSTNKAGDFRFYIPSGRSYFVQVTDRKGRTAATTMTVGRGQAVSLFLKP
jgi:hypothetical protein